MRFCWANYTLWAVIVLLGLAAMAGGCGAKGPLYLPERTQSAAPASSGAADTPDLPRAGR